MNSLPDWKQKRIEESREALVKKLQEEHKRKVDEAIRWWITNKK